MTERVQLSVSPAIDAGDAARAEMYVLLGTLLAGPPDEAILEMLLDIDTGEAEATPMTALWQSLQEAARATDSTRLSDEYFNLFIGLGRGELVPYASFYIHGFLMEKVLASLRTKLKTLGFELQEGISEPEDHVAALCETMGMIILESGLSLGEQSAFFKAYIESWMGEFFTDLNGAESADFYRVVAQLGQQFLEIESQYLAMQA
ncbi:MAG: molecular chaperone TorD family protein [Gammaproteobacteria bacterium]|nr:molecular chaperone TorD family protein [Gammaproteobacteria bacterium]